MFGGEIFNIFEYGRVYVMEKKHNYNTNQTFASITID